MKTLKKWHFPGKRANSLTFPDPQQPWLSRKNIHMKGIAKKIPRARFEITFASQTKADFGCPSSIRTENIQVLGVLTLYECVIIAIGD